MERVQMARPSWSRLGVELKCNFPTYVDSYPLTGLSVCCLSVRSLVRKRNILSVINTLNQTHFLCEFNIFVCLLLVSLPHPNKISMFYVIFITKKKEKILSISHPIESVNINNFCWHNVLFLICLFVCLYE